MCLVMEFIDGGTLTEFATQSWDDASKWNTEVTGWGYFGVIFM
jgi:hypothetical protein